MIHEFRVRWYQRAFHEALVKQTHDRLIAIWHRRAGKDEIVLNGFRARMFERVGTYWHCFPEYKQARKAIWNGVNGHTGKRRIDEAFPPQIRKRMQDDDMFIELINGATWQLLGSDRYDATVGSGPVGVAYSEWALCNPSAWGYHKPMIEETGGLAAFITTPRGNNHAKTMYDRAVKSERWFAELLTVEQTGALTAARLEESLAEYEDLYGHDLGLGLFEQEYLCSFSGAMIGAYWGGEMNAAERQERIGLVPINEKHPVHTAWDLGKAVNNPIWCFQVINGRPYIVDFYRPESDDLEDWCLWLDAQGYHGNDYVPHDIMHPVWGTKRTRFETLKMHGRKPKIVGMVSVAEGINAGRETIKLAHMHAGDDERGQRMQLGLDGLKNYRREWDDDLKTFRENPVKDWAEHIGSSFRYLGLGWRQEIIVKEKPILNKEVYQAMPDGTIRSSQTVKEAVEAMILRRRRAR